MEMLDPKARKWKLQETNKETGEGQQPRTTGEGKDRERTKDEEEKRREEGEQEAEAWESAALF